MALRVFWGEGWGSRGWWGGWWWWCRTWQVFDECNLIWICTWSTTGVDGRLLSHSDCCSCSSRFRVLSPLPLDVLLLRCHSLAAAVLFPRLFHSFTPHTFLYLLLHLSHPSPSSPTVKTPRIGGAAPSLISMSHVNPCVHPSPLLLSSYLLFSPQYSHCRSTTTWPSSNAFSESYLSSYE